MNISRFFFVILFCISFQSINSQPEELLLKTDKDFISPNFDGQNDFLKFRIEWKNSERLKNWTLSIVDESGKTVKIFQADNRRKRRRNFLMYIFTSDKEFEPVNIVLPKTIQWLGDDSNGKILPDGKYNCSLSILTENEKEFKSVERSVFLDSNYPKADIKIEQKYFSPNKDKQQDTLNIKQTVKGSYDDKWQGIFLNDKNEVIKTYTWDTKNIPFNLYWDGKDERGILLDSGIYSYQFTGEDKAQNKFSITISGIVLNQDARSIDIQSNHQTYSHNAQLKENLPVFIPFIPPKLKIDFFRFFIFKKTSKEPEIIQEVRGERIPDEILWDFKNQNGEIQGDGDYFFKLEVNSDGFLLSSYEKYFSINSKKLKANFTFSPEDFTPDGDGENDLLKVQLKFENRKIVHWTMNLTEIYGEKGKVKRKKIKSWSGIGNPSEYFFWEGIGDDGILIGSLSKLEFELTGVDDLNEDFYSSSQYISTGIMSVSNHSSIRISIPEGKLVESESKYLKMIRSLLNDYPGYKVEVQSHSFQQGNDHENLLKTEKRARSVFEKIYGKTTSFERFSFRGIGEVEPLLMLTNDYGFFKNERIDVVLSKE